VQHRAGQACSNHTQTRIEHTAHGDHTCRHVSAIWCWCRWRKLRLAFKASASEPTVRGRSQNSERASARHTAYCTVDARPPQRRCTGVHVSHQPGQSCSRQPAGVLAGQLVQQQVQCVGQRPAAAAAQHAQHAQQTSASTTDGAHSIRVNSWSVWCWSRRCAGRSCPHAHCVCCMLAAHTVKVQAAKGLRQLSADVVCVPAASSTRPVALLHTLAVRGQAPGSHPHVQEWLSHPDALQP
jgi:hypothetical protein